MAVAARIRGMEFLVTRDKKESLETSEHGPPAFGLGVMDIDGGVV